MEERKIIKSTCMGCIGNCGIIYEVEDNKIVKVKGDPSNPITKGYLCVKGHAVEEIRSSPERLKYPLKRIGSKGAGAWQQISWEEATDEIAARLSQVIEQYGPEAFVLGMGFSGVISGFNPVTSKFLHLLGSPNRLEDMHN